MAAKDQDQFLNLPFQEKLEFLYGLPARQKRDLILSAPEAARLVQSFSPQTLFYTLKEIGIADAGDLLSMAIPEQVKWLFDLDCWDKDRPNLGRMGEWIEAIGEGGRNRLADGLMELDLELVSLLLRRYVKVHRLEDPQTMADYPLNRFVQFDEHYLIEFIRHDQISPQIQDFLEEAFERDYNYFTGLMDEIYWGVEAELEEQAYQIRRGRLADGGFPDYFEAQDVFAYINSRQFLQIRKSYVAPNRGDPLADHDIIAPELALTSAEAENSLFNTALTAGFAAQGRQELRSEMALVSNQVLVARRVDFGDPEAVRVAVEMTHDYLNLGLENLAAGNLAAAIGHLRETHLKLLFRLGVSLTIDLRTRAEATMARLGLARAGVREVAYLDSPYREALGGFLREQPVFYGAIDTGGSVAMRYFRTMRDLHLAYRVLDEVEAMAVLFNQLLAVDIASAAFRAEAAGREIRLSQLLLTALARQALDSRMVIEPIEPHRLQEMRSRIMTHNGRPARLAESFRAAVDGAVAERLDDTARERSASFLNSCLGMLEEDLAELQPGRPVDARFIRSVLIRRD